MLKRLAGNSLAMLAYRLAQALSAFLLVVVTARLLGAYAVGQFTLANSYYFLFMSIASQGFKVLFTRELARNPGNTATYLVSGSFLQLVVALLAYVVLIALVLALGYSPDTTLICILIGLMVIPFSLSNVTESIMQAWEKMHLIAFSAVPMYVARVLVIVWLIQAGHGMVSVALVLVLSEILVLLLEWFFVLHFVRQLNWRINKAFMYDTLCQARKLIAIEGMAVFQGRAQVIILSLLTSEVTVGIYGAVIQFMQPFQIAVLSIMMAVFPSMSKAAEIGIERQRRITENTAEVLLMVAMPLTVTLVAIGGNLLGFIYSDSSFVGGAAALAIVALGLVPRAYARPLSYVLVANRYEDVNLREVIVTTLTGSVASIILISQYDLLGAAVSMVVISLISCSQYFYAVYKRLFSVRLGHTLYRPVLISGSMFVILLVLQHLVTQFVFILVITGLLYIALIGLGGIYMLGGPRVVFTSMRPK